MGSQASPLLVSGRWVSEVRGLTPVFTLVFKAQRFADPLKSIGGETLAPYR